MSLQLPSINRVGAHRRWQDELVALQKKKLFVVWRAKARPDIDEFQIFKLTFNLEVDRVSEVELPHQESSARDVSLTPTATAVLLSSPSRHTWAT